MSKKRKNDDFEEDYYDNPYLSDSLSKSKSYRLKGLTSIDHSIRDIRYKAYRGLFKDIEISKMEYLLLFFLFNAVLTIFLMAIALHIQLGTLGDIEQHLMGLIPGALIGLVVSAIIIDKLDKRVSLIKYLLLASTIVSIFQITFLQEIIGIWNYLCFIFNGFIGILLLFILLTLFLEYTSMMERGRILSFIFIELGVVALLLILIVGVGFAIFSPFLYIPLLLNALPIYYIYKDKQLERPPLREKLLEKSHANKEVIISILLILFFSFTIGITFPEEDIRELSTQSWIAETIILVVTLSIIFMIITTVVVGLVFDFIGRLATISNIILAMGIATFLNLFDFDIPYINLPIIFSSYIAGFMSIPLLIGDVTKRSNYGKILVLAFTMFAIGIILGIVFKYNIPTWVSDPEKSDLVLLGILYLGSIICLVLLVNAKESLPHKEQEWFESLVHLYIIHESGILLYEHAFIKEDRAQSDLVSGGIIGLISMLKEIMKGQEILKTIDHGDKKLMFKNNPKKDVLFVLLINEDLFVLRRKLDAFSIEFEKEYRQKLDIMSGIRVKDWKGVADLVDKFFERKYFEFFSMPKQ